MNVFYEGKKLDIENFVSTRKDKIVEALEALKTALAQETAESKQMLETYAKYTLGKATHEEIAEADKQFQDILKTLGLGVFSVLPLAPITIPLIIKISKKLGIDILPSAFKGKDLPDSEAD